MMQPFLTLVAGGSGRGLVEDGVVTLVKRFAGELAMTVTCDLDRKLGFIPVTNSWFSASLGFNRRAGSQRRQRAMKSRKGSSSHFKVCLRSFELGLRRRPLEDTVNLGFPKESKKSFLRVLLSIRCFSGGPKTSMMQASCSCSFSPGNIG